jgi:DNA invertase Pin-like site-specific DNA recombinase
VPNPQLFGALKDKQVALRSLIEGMNTTTASGVLLFHVFGALAQYERALIQERVVAGLTAARQRGRIGGRPRRSPGEKLEAIIAALDGGMSKAAVCRNFGVKRTTLIETLARVGWQSAEESRSVRRRAGSPVRPAGFRRCQAVGISGFFRNRIGARA